MGEIVKAAMDFSFDLPDEGYYQLRVEEVDDVKAESGGINIKVTSAIDGGQFDGQKHWENYGTRAKKNFGIRKLLGLLVASGKAREDVSVDSDEVETPEFIKELKSKLRGARYGAYLSHRSWKDREGKDKLSTSISKFLTVDEVKEKWREMEKPDVNTLPREEVKEPGLPALKPKASVWK